MLQTLAQSYLSTCKRGFSKTEQEHQQQQITRLDRQ